MVDLLAIDPLAAIPAPAIDILALKLGTRNLQAVVPRDTDESIRIVIGHPITKRTYDMVFGDAVSASAIAFYNVGLGDHRRSILLYER